MRDRLLAGDIVLVGPAEIAHRAEIDEADLQRLGGARRPIRPGTGGRRADFDKPGELF